MLTQDVYLSVRVCVWHNTISIALLLRKTVMKYHKSFQTKRHWWMSLLRAQMSWTNILISSSAFVAARVFVSAQCDLTRTDNVHKMLRTKRNKNAKKNGWTAAVAAAITVATTHQKIVARKYLAQTTNERTKCMEKQEALTHTRSHH